MAKQSNSGSIGFGGLLFLVFMVLKLTGYINWSWWYITMPLWIPVIIVLMILPFYLKARKKEEAKWETYREQALKDFGGGKESKFMQRLREAQENSERLRKEREN